MWTAKLKRFETWDRVLVVFKLAGWIYTLTGVVAFFVAGDAAKASTSRQPEAEDGFGIFPLIFSLWFLAYFLFAECYSLWAIWRHRRAGFIIQLVLASVTVFGAVSLELLRPSTTSTSSWVWIQIGIIALYCGIRAHQLRPTPAPPPLPGPE